LPDVEFERPVCEKCGWVGEPVPILGDPQAYAESKVETPPPEKPKPEGDCVVPTAPLRELRKPARKKD
jgi:hypothetical protein